MFATTNSPSGTTLGITVNKTPPAAVPIPYPSIGQGSMFNPATLFPKVLVQGFMTATVTSTIATTLGDVAGTLGGVVSNVVAGPAQIIMGSPSVLLGGKPAATQLSNYVSNGAPIGNTVANQVSPSCTNVIFAP